jgi:hypothetical protein
VEHLQSEPVRLARSSIECALVAAAIGGLVGLMIGPVATLLCATSAAVTHWWLIRCRSQRHTVRHPAVLDSRARWGSRPEKLDSLT